MLALIFQFNHDLHMPTQISKALLAEILAAKKRNKPIKGLGLEHLNGPAPVIPLQLTSSILRSTQFQVTIRNILVYFDC